MGITTKRYYAISIPFVLLFTVFFALSLSQLKKYGKTIFVISLMGICLLNSAKALRGMSSPQPFIRAGEVLSLKQMEFRSPIIYDLSLQGNRLSYYSAGKHKPVLYPVSGEKLNYLNEVLKRASYRHDGIVICEKREKDGVVSRLLSQYPDWQITMFYEGEKFRFYQVKNDTEFIGIPFDPKNTSSPSVKVLFKDGFENGKSLSDRWQVEKSPSLPKLSLPNDKVHLTDEPDNIIAGDHSLRLKSINTLTLELLPSLDAIKDLQVSLLVRGECMSRFFFSAVGYDAQGHQVSHESSPSYFTISPTDNRKIVWIPTTQPNVVYYRFYLSLRQGDIVIDEFTAYIF
jgi:hypothetical protein